jgi:copper homeostasis protein (lipoprotein)
MNVIALSLLLALAEGPPARPQTLAAARSYSGTIPCADCPGIRVSLNLLTDGSFLSRYEYLERKKVSVEIGEWNIERGRLVLLGDKDSTELYRVVDPETVRKLNAEGQEIETKLNYDLKRDPEFRLIGDSLRLSGMLAYLADAASITLCRTGQRLPVATGGDYPTLEREVTSRRPAPGTPLLAAFTGHLVERPKADGGGKQIAVVVDRFEKVLPGESCPPRPRLQREPVGGTPTGKTWTLVSLKGRPVAAGTGRKPLTLRFEVGSHRVSGSTGCNRLMGRYAFERDGLTLSALATSRKECKEGGETEGRFLKVLGDVTGWSISGDRLTLYARKEAVAEFVEKDED